MRVSSRSARMALPMLAALFCLGLPPARPALAGSSLTVSTPGDDGRWLHVRVQETTGDEETVHVNLPLSMVEAILPLLRGDNLRDGRIRLGHGMHLRVNEDDIDAARLRQLWMAIKSARDGEFVTVEGKRDNVRVAKQDGTMIIKATEHDGDRVDVKIPLPVVEALFSSGTDELDLLAAVHALSNHGDLQLTAVDEDSSLVRIWVDTKNISD